MSFLITGLPRSGTAWASILMSSGNIFCSHDTSVMGIEAVMEDIKSGGVSDSGCLWFMDEIVKIPNLKIVYLVRDVNESIDSFYKCVGSKKEEICNIIHETNGRLFASINSHPGMVVKFSDLFNNGTCEKIWKYCTGSLPDPRHIRKCLSMKVVIRDEILREAAGV